MNRWLKKIIIFIIAFAPFLAAAQDLDARSPRPNDPITRQQRSAEKKKDRQKKKQQKAYRKAQKRAMKIQSKETRKRMKKNHRKSEVWNGGKREFFLTRWFRKKVP